MPGLHSLRPISYEGKANLLAEFNRDFEIYDKLLYPSAGFDVNDVYYVNERHIKDFNVPVPRVFIHCDAANYLTDDAYGIEFFDNKLKMVLSIEGRLRLHYNDQKQIVIYKYQHPFNSQYSWLIVFCAFKNEEMLKLLLEDKVEITALYTICDGISYGMFGGYENSVPTVLYPFLYADLKLKYHISDFDANQIKVWFDKKDAYRYTRENMQNLYLLKPTHEVIDLLEMSDEELSKALIEKLSIYKEIPANTNEKLCIFDFRLSNWTYFTLRFINN